MASNARIDQEVVEVQVQGATGNLRADQVVVEALVPFVSNARARVDQEIAEALVIASTTASHGRIDQLVVEVLVTYTNEARVAQLVIEALVNVTKQLPITVGPIGYQFNQYGPELVPVPPGINKVTITGGSSVPMYVFASSKVFDPYKYVGTPTNPKSLLPIQLFSPGFGPFYTLTQPGAELVPMPGGCTQVTLTGSSPVPMWVYASTAPFRPYKDNSVTKGSS
jgi:hypothetical protein